MPASASPSAAHVGEAPRLLSIKQVCRNLGLSRTRLYELMAEGRLRSVTIGRRRLIPREAIEEFIASLPIDGGRAT